MVSYLIYSILCAEKSNQLTVVFQIKCSAEKIDSNLVKIQEILLMKRMTDGISKEQLPDKPIGSVNLLKGTVKWLKLGNGNHYYNINCIYSLTIFLTDHDRHI